MFLKDTCLIFFDNPISRFYIKLLLDYDIQDVKIIYLGSNKYNLFKKIYNYQRYNSQAANFLKNKNVINFVNEIEVFFNFPKDFCKEAYVYNNINKFNEIVFVNNNSINSSECIQAINTIKSNKFLISNKEILKEALKTNKRFFHIHPGFLPKIKGADGTLQQIYNFGSVGHSFLELNASIDSGKVFKRDKYEFQKLSANFKNFKLSEIYNIWFSFYDPLLRASMLRKLIDQKLMIDELEEIDVKYEEQNYYSFIKKDDYKKIFFKIFKKLN